MFGRLERTKEMDKYIVYENAIEAIKESTEWGQDEDNNVYAHYIMGVLDMTDRIVDAVENEEMNSLTKLDFQIGR